MLSGVLPNVVLVVFDTARRDAFEPYGARPGASPSVAQLASRGTASPLAYSTCNWTMPSHVGMFTGALPRTLGLGSAPGRKAGNVRPVLEANGDRVLAEVLHRAGYRTRGVSCNLWISRNAGFAEGFEEFRDVKPTRKRRLNATSLKDRAGWALEALRAKVDDGAGEAARTIDSWLAEGPHTPFFWFVNLVECHSPYLPPKPYNELGPIDRLRAAGDARAHLTLHRILQACAGRFDVSDETLERFRRLYAAEIRLMDEWLGRLLQSLDERGLLDETIVIVTSDHGENFGEGKLMGHALSLDDRLIHVPFVAAGPGIGSLDEVFTTASIPRMLAEAAGLRDHPWPESPTPEGVAVAQYNGIADLGDERIAQAAAAWGLDAEGMRRITTPMTAATDGKRKLIRYAGEELVIDLETDPLELSPVKANGDAAVARLQAALDEARANEREPARDMGVTESAELEERMRQLGYL
jgi:arylsulfatase A-like enzyme